MLEMQQYFFDNNRKTNSQNIGKIMIVSICMVWNALHFVTKSNGLFHWSSITSPYQSIKCCLDSCSIASMSTVNCASKFKMFCKTAKKMKVEKQFLLLHCLLHGSNAIINNLHYQDLEGEQRCEKVHTPSS